MALLVLYLHYKTGCEQNRFDKITVALRLMQCLSM